MRRRIVVVAILAMHLASGSPAAQRAIPFTEFKTFRCEFHDSEGRRVRDGKTSDTKGDSFTEPLVVDNLNYRNRAARLIGNAGASDLTILTDGRLAVTLAEYTEPGGVSIITIYKHVNGFDVHHRAVMSRHLAFSQPVGDVSMAQYYGTCRGLL